MKRTDNRGQSRLRSLFGSAPARPAAAPSTPSGPRAAAAAAEPALPGDRPAAPGSDWTNQPVTPAASPDRKPFAARMAAMLRTPLGGTSRAPAQARAEAQAQLAPLPSLPQGDALGTPIATLDVLRDVYAPSLGKNGPQAFDRLVAQILTRDPRFAPESYGGHDPVAGTSLAALRDNPPAPAPEPPRGRVKLTRTPRPPLQPGLGPTIRLESPVHGHRPHAEAAPRRTSLAAQAAPEPAPARPRSRSRSESRDASDGETSQHKNEKLVKNLTHDLVGLIQRPVDSVRPSEAPGGPVFSQTTAQVVTRPDGIYQVRPGATLDSVAIKRDSKASRPDLEDHNASAATIADETGALILGRSARSNSPARIEEMLLLNAVQALSGRPEAPQTGFNAQGEFQMVITSAMDLSPLKSKLTQVAPGGEDEVKMLKSMSRAIDQLFGDQPTITRRVQVGGEDREIVLRRPLLTNITLSGQSKDPDNIKRHRDFNAEAGAVLFDRLREGWQSGGTDRLTERFADQMANAQTLDQKKALFANPRLFQLQMSRLPPANRAALEGLRLMLAGEDRLLGARDPGHEFILYSHLFKATNCANTVQCKSGQDRTLQMVGLRVGMEAYEREQGRPFDPAHATDEQKTRFKEIFTDTVDALGRNMAIATRGKPKIKWGSHLVPRDYYIQGRADNAPLGQFKAGGTLGFGKHIRHWT